MSVRGAEEKQIFEKLSGKELSDYEAQEMGNRLVKFFELLIKADKQNRDKKGYENKHD